MNILPKKSWHVRSKKNIERVRRDEAEAAEKEKEKQRRIAIAESESRTDALRIRAKKRCREDDDDDDDDGNRGNNQITSAPMKHINFFQEEELGKKTSGTNAEYEAEKKEEKEKEEKAIGLLTYLGQSAAECQTEKPWYFKQPEKRQKLEDPSDRKLREEFDLKHKWSQDPMKSVTKYLTQKEKIEKRDKEVSRLPSLPALKFAVSKKQLTGPELTQASVPLAVRDKHHKKKKKKEKHKSKDKEKKKKSHKHKHHRKHKDHKHDAVRLYSEPTSTSTTPPSGGRTIQQLRAERLKREREERLRTEQLMAKVRGDPTPAAKQPEPTNDRERRYHSQFNPELIRKRKKKHSDYSS